MANRQSLISRAQKQDFAAVDALVAEGAAALDDVLAAMAASDVSTADTLGDVVRRTATASDADATRSALQSAGFRVLKEQQVVLVEVEDRPGSAASVFRRIADAKVNIRFSYLATRNRLVIAADDLQDLMTALAA